MPKPASKTFTARVEAMPGRLNWLIAYVPFDVRKIWGTGGMLKVRGEINRFAFRTSLFPSRSGRHFLLVNKKMRAGASIGLGDRVSISLSLDSEPRTVDVPRELERELKPERALAKWYGTLNYSTQKAIAEWISEPKSEEARKRRAQQIAQRLYETMDAERSLPPLLQAAFERRPRAFLGWRRMSALQRRAQLLAIFYYRNPESRARRIEKTLDAAESYADKSRA